MTKNDTTKDPATKAAALRLLARGLITQAEAARLTGASRQLVRHWARDLPLEQARAEAVERLWERELLRKR